MFAVARQARWPCIRRARATHLTAASDITPGMAPAVTAPPVRLVSGKREGAMPLFSPWQFRRALSSRILSRGSEGIRESPLSGRASRGASTAISGIGAGNQPGSSVDAAAEAPQILPDYPEFVSSAEESDVETFSDEDGGGESGAGGSEGSEAGLSTVDKDKHPLAMRLSRRIARSGIASRREAERMVGEGLVTVNGERVMTPALNVDPDDVVKVKGQSLGRSDNHVPQLWMVHKLRNELVTRHDPAGRPTIFERLRKLNLPDTLMPVGRLDFNTEGLLLLTNDGDLARKMELPGSSIVRTYAVRVYGNITEEKLKAMRHGCTIDGVRYKGMFVRVDGGGGKGRQGRNAWLTVECTEGKNRQIRKICKYLRLTVNRLARVRYGPFSLGKVRAGGVSRLPLPEAFLKSLDEGTAGGQLGSRTGRTGGPGPGVGKRAQSLSNAASSVRKTSRIHKGVSAPTSRGDSVFSRGRRRRAV